MEQGAEIERARAHLEGENLARAQRICKRVLDSSPDNPEALEILANIDMKRLRFSDAAEHFSSVLEAKPDHALGWALLGFCLQTMRQIDKALNAYETALQKDPDQYQALVGSGFLLTAAGKMEKARSRLKKAIKLQPHKLEPYRLLAAITKFRKGDPLLKQMERAASRAKQATLDEQAQILFALAGAYRQLGERKKFLDSVEQANALQRKMTKPWQQATRMMQDFSKQVFTPELFKRRRSDNSRGVTPVFIVGLPRSGSTLIEQILASHSKIFGADELPLVKDLFIDTMPGLTGSPYPLKIVSLSDEILDSLADKYQKRIARIAPGHAFVCDKQPGNALYVGMIRLVMPWAKVIYVRRHPYDTALSIYQNYFHHTASYACDLEELAEYFRITHDLMEHWRQVTPGFVLDVRYEDVVRNLERETRNILKFIGVPFEKQCLEFHKTSRPVFTHSTLRVRQKLDSSAVGRWKSYKDVLSPFIGEAGSLLEDCGY